MTTDLPDSPAPPTAPVVAPGWYPDPSQYGVLRWYDGSRWTEHAAVPQHPAYQSTGAPPRDRGQELLLPVNRTGLSIAAGYLGLFSILLIPAPVALVVSLLALMDLTRKPEVAGRGRAWFGLVAGALGTVGLFAVVAAGPG